MLMKNEELAKAGYTEVYAYWNGMNEEDRHDHGQEVYRWCAEHRKYITKYRYEVNDTKELYWFTNMDNVKKKECVVGVNCDKKEKEYIYLTLMFRGASEVYFSDDYTPTELTKYMAMRLREDIGKRMKEGREARIKRGDSVFSRCPYGYYMLNHKLRIDEYEAFIVRYIFYRTSQGASQNQICKELNNRGFKNRQEKFFNRYTVRTILNNYRIYQGYISFMDTEYKGNHTRLIDDNKLPAGTFSFREAEGLKRRGRKAR